MSIHDRWHGARAGPGKRWECRWRSGGVQRKRRFSVRQAAERFEAKQKLDPITVAQEQGRQLTVDQMLVTWLATKQGLKPKSIDAYEFAVREILLTFQGRLAAGVRPSEVQAWAARDRGAWLRRRALGVLDQAYRLAAADGLLAGSPCAGTARPKVHRSEMRFLSWDELARLADAAGGYRPLVWLLGTCGLRIGEAAGLRVGDVQARRGRIRISRSVVNTSRGLVVQDTTKTGHGRDVPVLKVVLDMLDLDRPADEPLFPSPSGGQLDPHNWRAGPWRRSVESAELGPLHPHELRHTAASLAIASGADVKAVQRMLGHASAAMTLDLYGHLWDAQLDTVAARMDAAGRAHMGRPERSEGAQKAPARLRLVPLNSTPDEGKTSKTPLSEAETAT